MSNSIEDPENIAVEILWGWSVYIKQYNGFSMRVSQTDVWNFHRRWLKIQKKPVKIPEEVMRKNPCPHWGGGGRIEVQWPIVPNIDIKTFWKTLILRPNKSTSECPQQLPHKLEFHSN